MISYGMILIRLRSSIKTNIRYDPNRSGLVWSRGKSGGSKRDRPLLGVWIVDFHSIGPSTFNSTPSLHKIIADFSNNCEIQKSASINIIVTILFFLICWTPFQYSLGQEQKFRQNFEMSDWDRFKNNSLTIYFLDNSYKKKCWLEKWNTDSYFGLCKFSIESVSV